MSALAAWVAPAVTVCPSVHAPAFALVAAVGLTACGDDAATASNPDADALTEAIDLPGERTEPGPAPEPSGGPAIVALDAPSRVVRGQTVTVRLYTDLAARAPLGGVIFYVQGAGSHLVTGGLQTSPSPASAPAPEFVDIPVTLDPAADGLTGKGFTVDIGLVATDGSVGPYVSWDLTVTDDAPLSCPEQQACADRVCGLDPQCGVQCGDCDAGFACTYAGQCEMEQTPGGTTTGTGTDTDAQCPQDADCSGRECGADPVCGIDCGQCDAGFVCTFAGRCETDPDTTTTGTTDPTSSTTAPTSSTTASSTTASSTTASSTTASTSGTATDTATTTDPSTTDTTSAGGGNPPTADAGPDRTVFEGSVVHFDASGTTEPDGDPLSFTWRQTGGPSLVLADADTARPSIVNPTAVGGQPTAYTFELTVTDQDGSSTDVVTITADAWFGEPVFVPGSPVRVELPGAFAGSLRDFVDGVTIVGDYLVTGGSDPFTGSDSPSFIVWDVSVPSAPQRVAASVEENPSRAVAFDPSRNELYVLLDDGSVVAYDVTSLVLGSPTPSLPGIATLGPEPDNATVSLLPGSDYLVRVTFLGGSSDSGLELVQLATPPTTTDNVDVTGAVTNVVLAGEALVVSAGVTDFEGSPIGGGLTIFDGSTVAAGSPGATWIPLATALDGLNLGPIAAAGPYVFAADLPVVDLFSYEPEGPPFPSPVYVVDVTDPSAPAMRPELMFTPEAPARALYVQGDELLVVTVGGVEVYDVGAFTAGSSAFPPQPIERHSLSALPLQGAFSPEIIATAQGDGFFTDSIALIPRGEGIDSLLRGRLATTTPSGEPLPGLSDVLATGSLELSEAGVAFIGLGFSEVLAIDVIGPSAPALLSSTAADGHSLNLEGDRLDALFEVNEFVTLDVSDAAAGTPPVLLGSQAISDGFAFAAEVESTSPGTIVVRTERPEIGCEPPSCSVTPGLEFFDVSDPTAPTAAGEADVSSFFEVRGLCGERDRGLLGVAAGGAGVAAFDVADPANAAQLATLNSWGQAGIASSCDWVGDRMVVGLNSPYCVVIDAADPTDLINQVDLADSTFGGGDTRWCNPTVDGSTVLATFSTSGVIAFTVDGPEPFPFAGIDVASPLFRVEPSPLPGEWVGVSSSGGLYVLQAPRARAATAGDERIVPVGGSLDITLTWDAAVPDVRAECIPSSGSASNCTLLDLDRSNDRATFRFAPGEPGDVEIGLWVGNHDAFAGDRVRLRAE